MSARRPAELLAFKLSVPPSVFKGAFSSTWTFSIASGP
jgi:hypothetical protein